MMKGVPLGLLIFAFSGVILGTDGSRADDPRIPKLDGLAQSDAKVPLAEPALGNEAFDSVYQQLKGQGVDPLFIDAISKDAELKFDEKFIHRNLLNFMTKDNYHVFLSKNSLKACRKFLKTHSKPLSYCEKKYSVPKEVITALLWVETKHGHDLGHHHVLNVYMNLAISDRKEILDRAIKEAYERAPATGRSTEGLEAKVTAAAKRKSAWATEQLVALSRMYKQSGIDVVNLKGSISGAFGIPQFIPKSYVDWAADGDGDGKIDLFAPPDAICSVANYLKINGWAKGRTAHRKAVYHYNRSEDYGDAVLSLARKLRNKGNT